MITDEFKMLHLYDIPFKYYFLSIVIHDISTIEKISSKLKRAKILFACNPSQF